MTVRRKRILGMIEFLKGQIVLLLTGKRSEWDFKRIELIQQYILTTQAKIERKTERDKTETEKMAETGKHKEAIRKLRGKK